MSAVLVIEDDDSIRLALLRALPLDDTHDIAAAPVLAFGELEVSSEAGEVRRAGRRAGRLRRRIEPDPGKPRHLVTLRGPGYQLQS